MKTFAGLGLLLLIATGQAMAQTDPCPVPQQVAGAVTDFELKPSSGCRAPDYTTSFGPFPLMSTLATNPTVVQAGAQGEDDAQEQAGTPLAKPLPTIDDVQEEQGGIRGDYNSRQLVRLGELDAMQGRPLNMTYAGDLGYLQGYTQGQQARQALPSRLGVPEQRRGFSGF